MDEPTEGQEQQADAGNPLVEGFRRADAELTEIIEDMRGVRRGIESKMNDANATPPDIYVAASRVLADVVMQRHELRMQAMVMMSQQQATARPNLVVATQKFN